MLSKNIFMKSKSRKWLNNTSCTVERKSRLMGHNLIHAIPTCVWCSSLFSTWRLWFPEPCILFPIAKKGVCAAGYESSEESDGLVRKQQPTGCQNCVFWLDSQRFVPERNMRSTNMKKAQRKFRAGKWISENSQVISKLMDVVPAGIQDPSPFLYVSHCGFWTGGKLGSNLEFNVCSRSPTVLFISFFDWNRMRVLLWGPEMRSCCYIDIPWVRTNSHSFRTLYISSKTLRIHFIPEETHDSTMYTSNLLLSLVWNLFLWSRLGGFSTGR